MCLRGPRWIFRAHDGARARLLAGKAQFTTQEQAGYELFRGKAQPHDVGEGTTCWPAPESTDNMNTSRVGRLGLSDAEEDAIVSFMQTLTDGFMPVNQQ
jgi:cytochrome c peroxidase